MADQQPEALAATCDSLVQQFTAFGADKKAVKEALTASAATIRALRAQVERLQAAGQVAAPAMVPQGWCLNSADFSLQCSDPTRTGTVMLIRDIAGRKAWHALPEDEAVSVNGPPLYITGRGMTFSEALEDAAKLAERTVGINGLTVGGSKAGGAE